jgi:protein gp37
MGDTTKIQWTDATWNPVRGCSVVSEGCRNCYAMHVAARFSDPGLPYEGLARRSPKRGLPQWTGKVRVVNEHLGDPLRWQKARRVFVNSMSDLFHEELPFPVIAGIFGIMGAADDHTFQVLTKRPERAIAFFRWLKAEDGSRGLVPPGAGLGCGWYAERLLADVDARLAEVALAQHAVRWPLPNVWLGVSVEDQDTADLRIHQLLECPAAVRFVSYEPALGPVEWHPSWFGYTPDDADTRTGPGIDWLIAGGESGPGARACDVDWLRAARDACARYDAACFVKQLGADPYTHRAADAVYLRNMVDRKGGNPVEWPPDLAVRDYPTVRP